MLLNAKKPKKPGYVTGLAKDLRRTATAAEMILWERLRDRRFNGLKFRRQKPIGRYIVDFYCAEKKLVIELDGSSHDNKQEYDNWRDEAMRTGQLHIIRISNDQIMSDLDKTLCDLKTCIIPLPSPISGRGIEGEGTTRREEK